LHDSNQVYTNDLLTDQVLKVDLLRRTRQFNSAKEQALKLSESNPPEVLRQILDFQVQLASAKDSGCYQVSDAMGEVGSE